MIYSRRRGRLGYLGDPRTATPDIDTETGREAMYVQGRMLDIQIIRAIKKAQDLEDRPETTQAEKENLQQRIAMLETQRKSVLTAVNAVIEVARGCRDVPFTDEEICWPDDWIEDGNPPDIQGLAPNYPLGAVPVVVWYILAGGAAATAVTLSISELIKSFDSGRSFVESQESVLDTFDKCQERVASGQIPKNYDCGVVLGLAAQTQENIKKAKTAGSGLGTTIIVVAVAGTAIYAMKVFSERKGRKR